MSSTQKSHTKYGFFAQIHYSGAYLLSPIKTIIGTSGLNCSVRNGKRCVPAVKAPEHYIRGFESVSQCLRHWLVLFVVYKFLNRNRNISTSRLNALLRFYLKPINLVISQGS